MTKTADSSHPVLIIGTGKMAVEYARLYRDGFHRKFDLASRTEKRAQEIGTTVGAERTFATRDLSTEVLAKYDYVVVANSEELLESTTRHLLSNGVKKILLEKPATLSPKASTELSGLVIERAAYVRVACNRRYYRSIRKLAEILRDEKPLGATFDFTELTAQIAGLDKAPAVKAAWGFVNPIHVVDTLSHLLGPIESLDALVSGKGEIPWHPSGAVFRGMGVAGSTPVSYLTSWLSPGRWDLQILTRNGRYKLSPMEKLVVMRHDSKFQWTDVDLETSDGDAFKPGVYDMVRAFEAYEDHLPDLSENAQMLALLSRIFGYSL